MQVGDGKVKIDDLKTIEDMVRYVNSILHPKLYIALRETDRILLRKGASRSVSEEYIETMESLNMPSIVNEIKTESMMKKVLYTVSNMASYNTKISLIILFIANGLGNRYQGIFKLDEDIKNPESCEDNKKINKLIEEFFKGSYKKIGQIVEEFEERVKADYPEDIANILNKIGDRLYLASNAAEILDMLTRTVKDINIREKVYKDIMDYRQDVNQYTYPLISDLVNKFNIPLSTYKHNKTIGSRTLTNIYGFGLLWN